MTIRKSGKLIETLEDWESLAGPKTKDQWVDGRSAKEAARAWLEGKSLTMPSEINSALANSDYFGNILKWEAEPEARLKFDDFKGEPRNSDLSVKVIDEMGPYLLTVEAKADESFGQTIAKTYAQATARLLDNPRSNGINRILQLSYIILGMNNENEIQKTSIRYQLLTACAGTLAEAEKHGYGRAVMLIQEFITNKTNDINHKKNTKDLLDFVSLISCGKVQSMDSGAIYGPFRTPGQTTRKSQVDLFFCKTVRNIRTTP